MIPMKNRCLNGYRIALFLDKRNGFKGLEGDSAERALRRLLFDGPPKRPDIHLITHRRPLRIEDLRRAEDSDLYVVVGDRVLVTREGVESLAEIALKRDDLLAVGPVSNLSRMRDQTYPPPFLYQTLSVFEWAVREIHETFGDRVLEVSEMDDFCLVFRKDRVKTLPATLLVSELPESLMDVRSRFGIAQGVYVHQYGDCYESDRRDLLCHVPPDAGDILDVGCANGLFGEELKKRQACTVTGIDQDDDLLCLAAERLDRVIRGDIEELVEREGADCLGRFDCIVCGDVLEHLNDPWRVVAGLRRHLKKGGLLVASVPNIANWAIVYEMLKGRWDYVPFSILSGAHIRFFTRDAITRCLKEAGYRIRHIQLQGFALPPRGDAFMAVLRQTMPGIDEEELRASEIVIIGAAS